MQSDHCSHNGEIEIFDWHQNILAAREDALREGLVGVIDWEVAKVTIRESIRPKTGDV